MNYSSSDILLASLHREIVVWRRMGGSNPGYGLDVDGTTTTFVGKGLTALKQDAQKLALGRGLQLAKPAVEKVAIVNPAGAAVTHTDHEQDRMLGRFYAGETEYAWGEPMEPRRTH
ncbi:MAG: hypothetical protein HGA45_21495 [Chloroflexales bacterium]|nr:hypothetical protein [Chloroflexales bacterium]